MVGEWQLPDRVLRFEARPLVMGIVNVTPDSFSDGGRHDTTEAAVNHAMALVEQGADFLDIGGESTRPGSAPVSLEEERRRVLPVIEALSKLTAIPLSVDTSKAEIARETIEAGASVVNDVTAATGDPDMMGVLAASKAAVILMHMRGTPATMQLDPRYEADVVAEVLGYLEARLQALASSGIAADRLAIDPGIGFGKSRDHNFEILARLAEFQRLGRPLCLGISRKGFLGKLLDRPVDRRLAGALGATCYAQGQGAVQIVRVHDVAETRDAVAVFALLQQWKRNQGIGGGETVARKAEPAL